MMHVYLIAGEASGDALGARLMKALKELLPDTPLLFSGVGGERMQKEGMTSLFPMTELSIMGFAEIIPHIPHLLRRIRQTAQDIRQKQPDIVITIDAPEFCFRVVKTLRKAKETLPCVHYVAPSVWAYRPKRVKKLAALYNHILALLPFEPPYFEKEGLPCTFVGHSIVEEATTQGDREYFRIQYQIPDHGIVLTLMPGSRESEFKRLWPIFAETAMLLSHRAAPLYLVIPTVNKLKEIVEAAAATLPLPTYVISDHHEKSHALAASDVALVKSGTGTFDVAIQKVPMVVAYKVKPFTAWLARRLLKVPFVNLINLVSGHAVIPEFLQEQCLPNLLVEALETLLKDPEARNHQNTASFAVLEQLGFGKNPSPSQNAAKILLQYCQKLAKGK